MLRMSSPAVATRQQLQMAGYTPGDINAQVDGRRWRRLNDDVIALHNGPLTGEQARLAVYLSAQRPAALCGLTATELWGLRGFETSTVHVVVRRGARVLDVPGVDVHVHESRRFDSDDVFTTYEPPRVSLPRATVDAAAWSPRILTASRILTGAVQQRLTTPAELRIELERAGRVRHKRVLTLLLNDLEGGAQALSEVEFMRFCRRHGFVVVGMNVRNDSTGRRRYLDAEIRGRNGNVVRVEVDGGIHLTLRARWQDQKRDNALGLRGIHPLRFTSVAIYSDDPEAVAQLRAAVNLSAAQ